MTDLKKWSKAYKFHSYKLGEDYKEEFKNQLLRVVKFLNKRYSIEIKSVIFGTVNDDIIHNKTTALFEFNIKT